MYLALGLLSLALTAQIPPPAIAAETSQDFKAKRRAILDREDTALNVLADRLARTGKAEAAATVRGLVRRATDSDLLTRFMPLPEVVKAGASATGLSSVGVGRSTPSAPGGPPGPVPAGQLELETIRKRAAADLLDLARQSAGADPPRWGLATECVRDAIEHDPDQAEARRLLGFEPYEGGWARPFAIRQIRTGKVLHPTYGWVRTDWVSHLERGELPAPNPSGNARKTEWLAADDADRLRADGNPPWTITTEHFQIRSNVPLSKTIAFGRRLEDFHEFFYAVMADVFGDKLPLARRIQEPKSRGTATYRPHLVYYFATRDQYLAHLRNIAPDVAQSLGYYHPFGPEGQKGRKPAYFFLDEGGRIDTIATLYHEVSHQLLFESPIGNAYTRNEGNYWVFEGLGTFFETVTTHEDGSMEVGGFVGPRIEEAVKLIVGNQAAMPTGLFVGLRMEVFNLEAQIYANYQQAMALTLFLMRGREGAYRDGFLDYVRDAVKGNLRPGVAPTLRDRLGTPYDTIDAQFLEFLKARDEAARKPRREGHAGEAGPIAPKR